MSQKIPHTILLGRTNLPWGKLLTNGTICKSNLGFCFLESLAWKTLWVWVLRPEKRPNPTRVDYAAAEAAAEEHWADKFPNAKEDIEWLLNKVNALSAS